VSWLDRDDREEVEPKPKWSPEPKCSCSHEGKPYLLDGVMVTSRDPSCRVHLTTLSTATIPLSAERIIGSWQGREKEK
jgi:hypothetical protein